MGNKNKIIQVVSLIAVYTLISKVLGLLRDTFTASRFGAGSELDAYFAASNLPIILFITIGAAITTTLIPLYTERVKSSKKEAIDFINNVLNFFILMTTLISIMCIILSKPLVELLNPGFHGGQLILTQKLTIVLIPTLILNAILYIFNGILQSENKFSITALVAIPFNLLIILYLLFYGKKYGVIGLTIITFIATFIQIIPQLVVLKKIGFKYRFYLNLKDPLLKKMGIMIIPVILGSGVQQINSFIERAVATGFDSGSLSTLSYSYRVFALIVDIFIVAISTVIYPKMARQSAQNQIDDMKETLSASIGNLIVLILPISLIVILQSKPIIYILFERGAFTRESTIITAKVLAFYSIGLLAFGLRDFMCKACYTLKDTKTPMINSAIAMVVNILLIFIFKRILGLKGLALANATSMYISCFLLIFSLRKKIGSIYEKDIFITFCKTIIAAVPMIFITYVLNQLLSINYTSSVLTLGKIAVSSSVGIMSFILVSLLLKNKEIIRLKDLFMIKNS